LAAQLLLGPGLLALPMSALLPLIHPKHELLAGGYTLVGLFIVGPIQYLLIGLAIDRYVMRKKKRQASANNTSDGIRQPADGLPKPSR